MFGILAALNTFSREREGREALNYENYIRTGQGIPSTKIYRESSVDRQARKVLANIRCKERIEQQIKFIRLMKKLLLKLDHERSSNEVIDEEIEQMRVKVTQLEIKVEKSARTKDINCEDMFDMDKPDDEYDIELEEIIRKSIEDKMLTTKKNIDSKLIIQDKNASGDHIQSLNGKDLPSQQ